MTHFGERLKSARKMVGLSMEALAIKAGVVTKQAISKYEKGQMNPGGEALIALSRALQVKPEYLLRSKEISLSELEFRKKSKLTKKEESSIKYQTLDFLERYLEIEDILGKRLMFQNPIPRDQVKSHEEAAKAAQDLRNKWELGNAPITNLMELLEEKGIRVYEIKTGEAFQGISARAGDIPVLAVREQDDPVRKRLTISHELGHVLLKFPRSSEKKAKEKLCFTFGAAFLLPKKVLRANLGHKRSRVALQELIKLKGTYGISIQAIMKQANTFNIISDHTYKNFWITVNARGWRINEPGEYLPKEQANRLDKLVFHAVAEDIITSSKGAELLNEPLSEFRREFQIVA